jgi:hypothetical protein
VGRKAQEAAEADVPERRIITIPAKDWERFEAWVASPAREIAIRAFYPRCGGHKPSIICEKDVQQGVQHLTSCQVIPFISLTLHGDLLH